MAACNSVQPAVQKERDMWGVYCDPSSRGEKKKRTGERRTQPTWKLQQHYFN